MEPLVSIIIPVYNAENMIKRCVDSVRYQTYTLLEIILVDDGSTDSSGIFCDQFAQNDDRITVIHKERGGVSSARNAGIQVAIGKYILFVDSDDYIRTDYIYRQVAKFEESNVDILICGYVRIKNNEKDIRDLIEKKFESLEDFSHEFLYYYNGWFINAVWNKMFRRELIQCYFDESISVGEDFLFNLGYLKNCKQILVCDITGYYYIVSQNLSLGKVYEINRIELIICLHNQMVEFYKQISSCSNVKIVHDRVFPTAISLYIVNLVKVKSISKHDKIKIINHLVRNKEIINGFKVPGIKKEEVFLKHLMKLKSGKLIYGILKSYNKASNN